MSRIDSLDSAQAGLQKDFWQIVPWEPGKHILCMQKGVISIIFLWLWRSGHMALHWHIPVATIKFMLSSSLLQLLFTDICYAFQSPSYPPGSSHPPLLLFSASSQVVAVHRFSCSQVGIHSLYKDKISSLPLLFLLFSPLLVSLFLLTELAMSSLLIFLSVLTLFSLLSTIALAPSKE